MTINPRRYDSGPSKGLYVWTVIAAALWAAGFYFFG
jgi:hypothetical protein